MLEACLGDVWHMLEAYFGCIGTYIWHMVEVYYGYLGTWFEACIGILFEEYL
jgi:hypothetical protein